MMMQSELNPFEGKGYQSNLIITPGFETTATIFLRDFDVIHRITIEISFIEISRQRRIFVSEKMTIYLENITLNLHK